MKANDAKWQGLSQDFKFTQLSEFKFISSQDVPFVVIQFPLVDDSLKNVKKSMIDWFNKDYLDQNGVYFLRLRDGYYIGETKDLSGRLETHIKNREIDSITVATYKAEEDAWNKDSIRDLESLLLQYAIETGMVLGQTLKNTKYEGRKLVNVLDKRQSEKSAKYIWDKITYLNLQDILDEAKSRMFASDAELTEIKTESVALGREKDIKETKAKRSGASKRLTTSGIIQKVNMLERVKKPFSKETFFDLVPRRLSPSSGYLRKGAEIFTKEHAKQALIEYLYKGTNVGKTDSLLTNNEKNNGYVTAATLAYLGIETNGKALGCLETVDELEAKERISSFVEISYI